MNYQTTWNIHAEMVQRRSQEFTSVRTFVQEIFPFAYDRAFIQQWANKIYNIGYKNVFILGCMQVFFCVPGS